MEQNEKIKAAYALNMWTVSIAQIIEYDDQVILEQEYSSIMNNLNLEKMSEYTELLDVITKILDEITNMRMDEGDRRIVDIEYQHKMRNSVWSSVPSVGAIFATSNPIAMGATLATQVGISYMNYRRAKSENELSYEKSKWQIQKNRMMHLHGLKKELFTTAWNMADKYGFKDEYRLTENQITDYNKALMESNPIKRYSNLEAMKDYFDAYPPFWYQMGSTANSVYRGNSNETVKAEFEKRAIKCFEKYEELNQFNLLRDDPITSAWALELLELKDLCAKDIPEAKRLIVLAEKNSGNALDILELCAFEFLKIKDYNNASRLFKFLVMKNYNSILNTQILSAIYIVAGDSEDEETRRNAEIDYELLKAIADEKYIISKATYASDALKGFEWSKDESPEEFLGRQTHERQEQEERARNIRIIARPFYQQKIKVVYNSGDEELAETLLNMMNRMKSKLDDSNLPAPSKLEYKVYKEKQEMLEEEGYLVILIGDSSYAKKIYRKAGSNLWSFGKEKNNLGIRIYSEGKKNVILIRPIKNKHIDDLIKEAEKRISSKDVLIPDAVKSVKFSFLKDCKSSVWKNEDGFDKVVSVITTIVVSPLVVVGQLLELLENGGQEIGNLTSSAKITTLQYGLAFIQYLDMNNALIE